MDTCEHCKWWDGRVFEWERAHGQIPIQSWPCRRKSPGDKGWPLTQADQWCGDFERKEPKGEQG